jgi:hypothetical protein
MGCLRQCRFLALFFVMPASMIMNTLMHLRAKVAIWTGAISEISRQKHEVRPLPAAYPAPPSRQPHRMPSGR